MPRSSSIQVDGFLRAMPHPAAVTYSPRLWQMTPVMNPVPAPSLAPNIIVDGPYRLTLAFPRTFRPFLLQAGCQYSLLNRTRPRRLSDPGPPSRPSSPSVSLFFFFSIPITYLDLEKMYRSETIADKAPSTSGSPTHFHRTQTIEFAPTPKPRGKFGHGRMLDHGPLQEEPDGILSPEHSRVSTSSSPVPRS